MRQDIADVERKVGKDDISGLRNAYVVRWHKAALAEFEAKDNDASGIPTTSRTLPCEFRYVFAAGE